MQRSLSGTAPRRLTHGRRLPLPRPGEGARPSRVSPGPACFGETRCVSSSAPSPLRRWVRSATGPGRGRRALYALLSVPLAAVYAALFAGLVASAVLAV